MVMQVLMSEPVMAANGCTYEKTDLQTWLQDSLLSPVTGNMMEHTNILPNSAIKRSIQAMLSQLAAGRRSAASSVSTPACSSRVGMLWPACTLSSRVGLLSVQRHWQWLDSLVWQLLKTIILYEQSAEVAHCTHKCLPN